MSDKAISKLAQLARQLRENSTPSVALQSLISAGILNSKQEFTEPYKELGRVTKHQGVRSQK